MNSTNMSGLSRPAENGKSIANRRDILVCQVTTALGISKRVQRVSGQMYRCNPRAIVPHPVVCRDEYLGEVLFPFYTLRARRIASLRSRARSLHPMLLPAASRSRTLRVPVAKTPTLSCPLATTASILHYPHGPDMSLRWHWTAQGMFPWNEHERAILLVQHCAAIER